MMLNKERLRQIAEYQRETGCRVEHPPATILALLDELEAKQRRVEFLLEHFTNHAVWTEESIDRAIEERRAKGLD